MNPAYKRIVAWISSVGAAIAINDLHGNGRPDDICLVDTRSDSVIVTPTPGTGDRYAPFVLDGNASYARVTYSGDMESATAAAKRHCAPFERVPQFREIEENTAYFECVKH